MTRTALYRFFDADGVLQYVGITDDTYRRWRHHETREPWWAIIATIRIQWFGTREDAETAETQAIITEAPLHNVRDVPGLNPKVNAQLKRARDTPFWLYVREAAGPVTPNRISKRMGRTVPACDVARWKLETPDSDTIIEFARTFDRHPLEALYRAGRLTDVESRGDASDLSLFTDAELVAELGRRLNGSRAA